MSKTDRYMMASLPDRKFKRVKGHRVGNLFVHQRIYGSLALGLSCRWVYKLALNQYQISHLRSGYSLGDLFRFSSEQKALGVARKLDAAIPQFKHSVRWFTKYGKPIGEKARGLVCGKH